MTDNDVHEMGHELRDIIAATVEAFVSFQESQGVRVSSYAILLAIEMEASVVRRFCRTAGITKAQIKELQEQASDCAEEVFEAIKEAKDDMEEEELKHDIQIVSSTSKLEN